MNRSNCGRHFRVARERERHAGIERGRHGLVVTRERVVNRVAERALDLLGRNRKRLGGPVQQEPDAAPIDEGSIGFKWVQGFKGFKGSGGTFVTVDNSRQGILERFREQIARGEPIIGGGAGTGLSAKSEEAGGIDLLIVYNSGRYRMAGRGSTAGLHARTATRTRSSRRWPSRSCPSSERTPVLAGVCGTDPFMMPRLFLEGAARARLRRHPELPDRRL